MKVGEAITEGMRADRRRDLVDAMLGRNGWSWKDADRMKAWCWWGWNISGRGGLGRPGL